MSVYQMGLVWRYSRQSGNALLILLKIADYANDSGLCFPGVGRLAEAARISQRQARTILRQLEATGELKVYLKGGPVVSTRGGLQHLNLYRILIGGQEGGEVDFRTLEVRGGEVSAQGTEAATSAEPSVEPPEELPTVVPLSLVGQTEKTGSPNGKGVRGKGEVAAVVDAYRALPGVRPSGRDGGAIAGLVGKYGKDAVLRALGENAPELAAADNPLLWLASRFKRPAGRGGPGETMAERAARYAEMARGRKP